MAADAEIHKLPGGNLKNKPRRSKVKTGCRTCKTRKVKCDEQWPACRRCRDTGRICDGYGVWGGGSSTTLTTPTTAATSTTSSSTSPPRSSSVSQGRGSPLPVMPANLKIAIPPGISATLLSDEEHYYFDWFAHRTAFKLPGAFVSPSATALLFQASSREPAVLHAVLALSGVHQSEWSMREYNDRDGGQDMFILRQYNMAIGGLQRCLMLGDHSSTRLSLVACLIFVFLEFLRGHYQSGLKHLHSGFRLLQELLKFPGAKHSYVDIGMTGAILRLYVQAKLFGQEEIRINPSILAAPHDSTTVVFESTYHARRLLEYIFLHIFELQAKTKELLSNNKDPTLSLQPYEFFVQEQLRKWNTIRKSTIVGLASNPRDLFAYQLMLLYHDLARLMISTATSTDQTVFDDLTDQFLSIVSRCITIYTAVFLGNFYPLHHPDPIFSESRSISDIGWIPPLYFTALKCRVHRVRLHAIRLIKISVHREGMWDANLVAAIGTKVMQLEEQDMDGAQNSHDDFDVLIPPRPDELSGPVPSEDRRFSDVDVVLPKDLESQLTLTGWKQDLMVSHRAFEGVYDCKEERWTDSVVTAPFWSHSGTMCSKEMLRYDVDHMGWASEAVKSYGLSSFLTRPNWPTSVVDLDIGC